MRATAEPLARGRHVGHNRSTSRPAHRVATAQGARTPVVASPDALVGLQRTAGNRAVSSLVLQRVGGWVDADKAAGSGVAPGDPQTGWNVEEHAVGGIRRIPIDGLLGGLQSNPAETKSAEKLTDEKVAGKVKGAARSDAAEQKGRGRAIALVPTWADTKQPGRRAVPPPRPHGEGGRDFAGWRQHESTGKVRDVERDRIAQQIEAAKSDQIVGILPQGVGESELRRDRPERVHPRRVRSAHGARCVDRRAAELPDRPVVAQRQRLHGRPHGRRRQARSSRRRTSRRSSCSRHCTRRRASSTRPTSSPRGSRGCSTGHLARPQRPGRRRPPTSRPGSTTRCRSACTGIRPTAPTTPATSRSSSASTPGSVRNAKALGANAAVLRNLVVFVRKTQVGHEGIVRSGVTESLDRPAYRAAAPPTATPRPRPRRRRRRRRCRHGGRHGQPGGSRSAEREAAHHAGDGAGPGGAARGDGRDGVRVTGRVRHRPSCPPRRWCCRRSASATRSTSPTHSSP